jgi:hypothetical protein
VTRALERRIARLEAMFGVDGCTCSEVPACVVIRERGRNKAEIEADAEAQMAARRSRCAIHGEREPAVIVQLRSFSEQAGKAA